MLGSPFLPLFILLFLILCFLLFVWTTKKKPEAKKNIPNSEGFQASSDGSSIALGKWSGGKTFPSQFDSMNSGSYGQWTKTIYDSFYDTYADNEVMAIGNAVSKLKDLTPPVQAAPIFGSTLGAFDSDTTQIPWDADNASSTQSDIVWGNVSEQTSRSIFLKTWIQALMADASKMEKCGGEESPHFCYTAPMLGVTVTDPIQAYALTQAESALQALGQSVQMSFMEMRGDAALPEATYDQAGNIIRDEHGKPVTREVPNTFSERYRQNREIFGGKTRVNSHVLERVPTVLAKAEGGVVNATGFRKMSKLAANLYSKAKDAVMRSISRTKAAVVSNTVAAISSANSAAAAATAAAVVQPALAPLAFAATLIATFTTWFFGTFQMILMFVETLITPIVNAAFKVGGICPSGSKQFSTLVPSWAMSFISGFVPMGSFLQLFDPFICWSQDGSVHLMQPPKIPPFMSNRALSLIYHSKWTIGSFEQTADPSSLSAEGRRLIDDYLAGKAPNRPAANVLNIVFDPPPPNFEFFKDSDVSRLNNANALISWANMNSAVADSNSLNGSMPPSALLVEKCPTNSTPSTDGHECLSDINNTNVVQPTMAPCTAVQFDDGFNCWTSAAARSGCSGGEVTFSSSTTWDDTYGFMTVGITPITGTSCNQGAVVSTFNQRVTCPTGYEKDLGGTLCYARCRTGYSRVGALCRSAFITRTRKYMMATHSIYYDQPYTPETLENLSDVRIPYCDFSSGVMLNKMAQFYYNSSLNNPVMKPDGTIQIQMITSFLGVTASSELSCDVACMIDFITYDPVTGGNYSSYVGCTYSEDPAWETCNFCFRRFYFIKGPSDPQGEFTVTGCTFADYTAPDAMVKSSDEGANPISSLPKVWDEHHKDASIFNPANLMDELKSGKIAAEAAFGTVSMGVMIGVTQATTYAGGKALGGYGAAFGGLAGGVGGGMAGQYIQEQLTKVAHTAIDPDQLSNTADTVIVGPDMYNLSVVTNDSWWTVNQGPIYELAKGYVPTIDFCATRRIGNDHCTHKYVIRDMVDKYHAEFQENHIKYITGIEPRGSNGCYYSFVQVLYDPNTNIEGVEELSGEIILQHKIKDYATCTYSPTQITTNMHLQDYPIRAYVDPATLVLEKPKMLYPTRDTAYKSDLVARFVRVRAAATNGFLNLSQIAVFDISGINVSTKMSTYATSTGADAATPDSVVNGTTTSGSTLAAIWEPSNPSSASEYWEVDLSQNTNISEIVYIGGSLGYTSGSMLGSTIPGRNIGVQIQFLYTNGATDQPIYTITLPTDDAVQYIPLFSSSYTRPMYPISGPIMIPRPISHGLILGTNYGCINKCEDRDVMSNLILAYNTANPNSQIMKILRGLTASNTVCEYQAETMTKITEDTKDADGNVVPGKRSVQKEYISFTLEPTIAKLAGHVFARFVRIIPSFIPGTTLEISSVNIWNAVPDGTSGKKKAGYNISNGKPTSGYNNLYSLDLRTSPTVGQEIVQGGSTAKSYPHVFSARDNDPATYFEIDLLGGNNASKYAQEACIGNNYEIFMIQFIGRSDRTVGGIKGIQIELYADQAGDEEHCCDGTYPPIYRYILPSDDTTQMIVIAPPAQCNFTIQTATILPKPVYLTDNTVAFTATDTSGGVFAFSGLMDTMRSAWNALMPIKSEDMVTPITANVKQSDAIVHNILETVAQQKTISGTTSKCNDTGVMSAIMTAYNIARGPSDTDEFAIQKSTMNRILKSGQSTANTCDVLYEEVNELYDDYIKDITNPADSTKNIKATRFIMKAVNGIAVPALDVPNKPPNNIVDLSSNALGIITQAGNLPTVFTGPSYAVNCRDPTILTSIASYLEQLPRKDAGNTVQSSFTNVLASFQTTPLACEYMMNRDDMLINNSDGTAIPASGNTTYVKALFNLGGDGKTTTLGTVTEYYPDDITNSADYTKYYRKGSTKPITLPSIYEYEHETVKSKRVNSTVQEILHDVMKKTELRQIFNWQDIYI